MLYYSILCVQREGVFGSPYRCLWKTHSLQVSLRPAPCEPEAETSIQPLIRCFRSWIPDSCHAPVSSLAAQVLWDLRKGTAMRAPPALCICYIAISVSLSLSLYIYIYIYMCNASLCVYPLCVYPLCVYPLCVYTLRVYLLYLCERPPRRRRGVSRSLALQSGFPPKHVVCHGKNEEPPEIQTITCLNQTKETRSLHRTTKHLCFSACFIQRQETYMCSRFSSPRIHRMPPRSRSSCIHNYIYIYIYTYIYIYIYV